MSLEKVNIGISDENREQLVESLNKTLADEFLLYTKARNYHWNVVGSRFHSMHEFLEEQYEQIAEFADEVAEFVRQLGGTASGTMTDFVKMARLQEQPGRVPNEDGMLRDLVADHEAIVRTLRHDADRADELGSSEVNDFLIGLMEKHNKLSWMSRSLISRENVDNKGLSERSLTGETK